MTEKGVIRERHIIDSAQIIDFVDLNSNTTSDLGTGGGMPGLIVAIVMKKRISSLRFAMMQPSGAVQQRLEVNGMVIRSSIF